MNEKTCPRCGRVLSVENFAKNVRMRDGLQCWCRECLRDSRKDRKLTPEQRERERQRKQEYRQSEHGRSIQREQMRRYRATPTGRAATRNANAAFHERHKETRNAEKRARLADPSISTLVNLQRRIKRAENPDLAALQRERYKLYMQAERENVNQRRRARYHANPEHFRARSSLTRAKRASAPGSFSGTDIRDAFARQSSKCLYCGCKVGRQAARWEVDHFIPLSRGGSNRPENIVLACRDCNRAKSNKMPWEFKAGVMPM